MIKDIFNYCNSWNKLFGFITINLSINVTESDDEGNKTRDA